MRELSGNSKPNAKTIQTSALDLSRLRARSTLAAGLTGTVAVSTAADTLPQGNPGAAAVIVARLPGTTTASDFAYDTGAAMPGLAAPARRVGLFLGDNTAAIFTANGWALFDAAVTWARNQGGGLAAALHGRSPNLRRPRPCRRACEWQRRSPVRATRSDWRAADRGPSRATQDPRTAAARDGSPGSRPGGSLEGSLDNRAADWAETATRPLGC